MDSGKVNDTVEEEEERATPFFFLTGGCGSASLPAKVAGRARFVRHGWSRFAVLLAAVGGGGGGVELVVVDETKEQDAKGTWEDGAEGGEAEGGANVMPMPLIIDATPSSITVTRL